MSVVITLEFEDQVVTDSKLLVIECSHLVRHHSVVTKKIVLTYMYCQQKDDFILETSYDLLLVVIHSVYFQSLPPFLWKNPAVGLHLLGTSYFIGPG